MGIPVVSLSDKFVYEATRTVQNLDDILTRSGSPLVGTAKITCNNGVAFSTYTTANNSAQVSVSASSLGPDGKYSSLEINIEHEFVPDDWSQYRQSEDNTIYDRVPKVEVEKFICDQGGIRMAVVMPKNTSVPTPGYGYPQ